MIPSSGCPPWHPDRTSDPAEDRPSYTTRRGTIEIDYCLWLAAVCSQIDAALLIRERRATLFSAVIINMGFVRSSEERRGSLHLAHSAITSDSMAGSCG